MFLGRCFELSELNNQYQKKGFKFVVVYGRRRVGKTALIAEFAKDKDHVFYISIERNDKAALDSFSAKIFERFPPPAYMPGSFASWDSAFEYIATQAGEKRIIIAIDEYPYLVSGNPSISSVIQKHIDTRFKQSNLFLILCGSSMSFMQNQVLGYESPLYGRRSAQFHIKPFDYYDSGSFFKGFSSEEKMLAYAVCGGIPQYLNAVAECRSVSEGIIECFLKKSGALYEEPDNLLKQKLREPAVYNTLVTSIANGASKLNDISTKSGEEGRKCAKYIKSLMELHIVRKEQPYGVKSERNGIYLLVDNMFKFWYRFIPQNMANIESGLGKQVYDCRILPCLSAYMGRIFEEACREYMQRQNGSPRMPFMFNGIGRWWGTNPNTKTQEEVDILADADGRAIFGECKWTNADVGLDVPEKLREKSMLFSKYSKKDYILFSKSGFSKSVKDYATKTGISLIDLDMLYE